MEDVLPRIAGKYGVRLLILLALLLTAGCDKQPAISSLGPNAMIVAFGDSLTHGTGAPRERSYPRILESLLGIKVVNAGVPGEITSKGRERLPSVLAEHRPDLVLLCHGGNDMLRRRSLENLADNLRAMIEMCRAAGADVVLVGVPRPGLMVEPPELYEQIAEGYDIPYAGDILTDLLTERDYKSDAIHPNAAGYRKLAEALAALITEAQSS